MIPHEPWKFPMKNGHFTIINSIHFWVPQKLRYIVDTSTYIASHWLLCNHVLRCMWCRLSSPIVGQLCLDFASYFHKTIDFSGYPMSAVSITLNYCYFSVLLTCVHMIRGIRMQPLCPPCRAIPILF
jgi:hypothetical protein